MRILWIGDAGCTTGFATVTHNIGERLVAKGHDVHVLAINHKGDYWPTSLKLYMPTLRVPSDAYGKSRIIELMGTVEPDVVIMLGDPQIQISYIFENAYDPQKVLLQYRPLLGYIPIDGHNLPPGWSLLGEVMKRVAMTKFGRDTWMPEAPVVYHGVDTDTFYPISAKRPLTLSNGDVIASKKEAKVAYGFDPDGFLILRVDTNSGRKDYPASWKALQPVMERHPDIQVHFHTTKGQGTDAIQMEALTDRNPATKSRFFFPGLLNSFQGWPTRDLVGLYNAADLFLSTSRGEGFGLTIAEAEACGLPVVAQRVSAIPEIVGPGGILLEPEREITVPSGEDQWLPNISAFSDALEHLYNSRAERREMGLAAREHVAQFSWDYAADRFSEYAEALAAGTDTGESSNAVQLDERVAATG